MSLFLFWQDHPLNDSAFVLSLAFDTCSPSGAYLWSVSHTFPHFSSFLPPPWAKALWNKRTACLNFIPSCSSQLNCTHSRLDLTLCRSLCWPGMHLSRAVLKPMLFLKLCSTSLDVEPSFFPHSSKEHLSCQIPYNICSVFLNVSWSLIVLPLEIFFETRINVLLIL